MDKLIEFSPNWVSLPGSTIIDVLEERNLSIPKFASQMGVNVDQIDKILKGTLPIDNTIANLLEKTLGGSEEFWINREKQYRESIKYINEINREWLKELPIRDMVKHGWINGAANLVTECFEFFKVLNVNEWRNKYNNEINQIAFRTSPTFKTNQGATAAWLRRGEIVTEKLECKPWNLDLFVETLEKIKLLTRKKNPQEFIPQLISLCSSCGVAVGVVQTPAGCTASGATKFLSNDRALLLLSFRFLSDDQFWFTFFHEAGHLVLHGKRPIHIESSEFISINQDEENEANAFSAEILIPYPLHSELKSLRGNKRNIINFAIKAGVSPGIVIGQMQYLGIIDYKYLNSYKRRYNWDDINLVYNYPPK